MYAAELTVGDRWLVRLYGLYSRVGCLMKTIRCYTSLSQSSASCHYGSSLLTALTSAGPNPGEVQSQWFVICHSNCLLAYLPVLHPVSLPSSCLLVCLSDNQYVCLSCHVRLCSSCYHRQVFQFLTVDLLKCTKVKLHCKKKDSITVLFL